MAERAARYQRSQLETWGVPGIATEFIRVHGDRVLHGPLAGLRYWPTADAPVAKLLGAYEQEVAPWIAQALRGGGPPVFVNLGAADGFYAVGVKLACPQTRVIAYELALTAWREVGALASMNGVVIERRGKASARALTRLPLDRAVVLCDVEGAEMNVLTQEAVWSLANTTVIVELHERARPGVTDVLKERFAPSHDVEVVEGRERDQAAYPELAALPSALRAAALDEHRGGPMRWARFRPR